MGKEYKRGKQRPWDRDRRNEQPSQTSRWMVFAPRHRGGGSHLGWIEEGMGSRGTVPMPVCIGLSAIDLARLL